MKKGKKCKTGGPLYANGGQLFDTIGQLAPLLGLIPGVGQAAAPLVGMGASFLGNKARQGQQNNNGLQATGYTNSNAFGYAEGGSLQSLNSTSKIVTGAPNEIDGNQVNYKGTEINLNHGETLDTNRDRVISDKYINPATGKKIIDEDKRLKSLRGKAEKQLANTNDLATKNTIKRLQEQEDNLYNIQEMQATKAGDRNTDGSTVQAGQRYAQGGPIQGEPNYGSPKATQAQIDSSKAQYLREMNDPMRAYIDYNKKPLEWFDIPQGTTNRFSLVSPPLEKLGYNSYNVNNNTKETPRYLYDSHQDQYLIRNVGGKYRLADREQLPILQKSPKFESGGSLDNMQPKDNKADIIAQMAEIIRNINQPQPLGTSTRPELFPEQVDTNGINSSVTNYPTNQSSQVSTGSAIKSTAPKGKSNIKELQRMLVEKGYDNVGQVGMKNDIDGVFGSRTKAALRDALASGKIDKLYESYLNLPSKQSSSKTSSKGAIANKVAENKQDSSSQSVRDEAMPSGFDDTENSDYKWNTNIDWQKMMANSKQKPTYMPEPKKKKEKSIGVADMIYGKFLTGGTLKSYAPGGYIDPLDPLALRPLGQVAPTYDFGVAPRSVQNMSVTGGTSNQPGLSNVSNIVNSIGQSTAGSGGGNMWSNMTPGEKVGMGSAALSVALKATDAFGKVQKEPYRYNNAAISLNQLDPTAVLNNNQASYQSALNDLNNNSSTGSNRQAIAANLFNNKLRANNDVMTKYGEQNSNLATQYEQRLADRNQQNNSMAYNVDDLNSRNKGAAQQMRQGVWGDLAALGLDQANILNNRMSQQATLEALKKMAPHVYKGLMENIKLK